VRDHRGTAYRVAGMCGICGLVAPSGAGAPDRAAVDAMLDAIRHRGPDDGASTPLGRCVLGHRRLRVIDLETGYQPVTDESGELVAVFNGEVYNFPALREELAAAGHEIRGTGDTPIVPHLYEEHGERFVERLHGMFALALWDGRTEKLLLARDRVGKKPLLWTRLDDGTLAFASELKALTRLAGLPRELDLAALDAYLSLQYVPGPGTALRGIHKLPPGHRLSYRLADGTWSIHRYWQLHFRSPPLDSARDYEREFEDRFLAAVRSHLITSDVPVGILLSGGLDSSAVAAASVELGITGLHTFSVGFRDGGKFSELAYARQVAQHIGARHHEIAIGEREFIDFLDDFVWYMDEPQADLASVPLHYVSQLARQNVKVVLSGEGADEILAGYELDRFAAHTDRRRRAIGWMPRVAFGVAARFFDGQRADILNMMSREGWSAYVKAWAVEGETHWSDDEKRRLWRGAAPARPTGALIRSWYDAATSPLPTDRVQQVLCGDWLVEDLLMKADKMTMANSIELRVPFLDRSLIEWAQTLPLRWKVGDRKNGYATKSVLRSYAAKRLPREIIDRPKQGFPVPAYVWLRDTLAEWAQDRLRQSNRTLRHWIDTSEVAPIFGAARNGDIKAAHKIWVLIVLDAWARRWL